MVLRLLRDAGTNGGWFEGQVVAMLGAMRRDGVHVVFSEVLGGGFRWLSELRGKRVFHPDGVAFRALWRTKDREALTGVSSGDLNAVVRLSRGVGLPEGFPDVLGVAIKVLDAGGDGDDLDLLLARSGSGAIGRRLLVPARDFTAGPFSSLLPYATPNGSKCPVTAVIRQDEAGPGAAHFEALRDADVAGLTVALAVGGGRTIASVAVGDRLEDAVAADLRFDPSHHGGPLRPVGWVNRVRMPVYAASQDGRDAPPAGARSRLTATARGRPAHTRDAAGPHAVP